MYILKNIRSADVFGPYDTKRHALTARNDLAVPAEWEPQSIGKRSTEQAMELGAAINSAKVAK